MAGEPSDLPSPLPPLALDLSRAELRDTAYEILSAAWRAATAATSSSSTLASVGIFRKAQTQPSLTFHASAPLNPQKSLTSSAASTLKHALGLRSKKSSSSDPADPHHLPNGLPSSKSKKPATAMDIVKSQMQISDRADARIKRALTRTAAGQVGKRVESILLPLELLQQIRLADFADVREYQPWQKRQLKVLECGLLLHPGTKLDQSGNAAQRLRQLLHGFTEKPLETGKHSESMQALRSAATALVGGDNASEVCHWADGFPFNLHLYQMLLLTVFDRTEETDVIDEVDDVVELLKKAWGMLGVSQALHNVCLLWVLFRQFVITGEMELDLLGATNTQMMEVAGDAKDIKDPSYVSVLRSTLSTIQAWAEKRFLAYHDTFPAGGRGVMESLLPVALSAAKILHEDLSQEFHRKKQQDVDVASTRIDVYVRSSLKTAFAQIMEQVDVRRKSMKRDKGPSLPLVTLAKDTVDLVKRENNLYSPFLRPWHPFAASLAAATLHSCFRRELMQYLNGAALLTPEVTEVLRSADKLETCLVQIAVEDAVDAEDGGKGIIREMTPFEAEKAITDLSRSWIKTKTDQLCEWLDRSVRQEDCSCDACERNWSSYSLIHTKIRNRLKTTQLEKLVYCRANLRLLRKLKTLAGPMQAWDPKANKEHYAQSVVEMLRIIEETFDAFLALPVEHSSLLEDLVTSIDKTLLRYATSCKSNCGSKAEIVPPIPALTRCSAKKRNSGLGGLWRKKESSPGLGRGKSQKLGNVAVGAESSLSQASVRINTLYYILRQVEQLEKRVGEIHARGKSRGDNDTKGLQFERTRAAAQDGIQQVCEIAAYKVVYQDLRAVFWDGLYVGGVAEARIGKVLEGLERELEAVATVAHVRLRDRVAAALMRVCFEALLLVLLAGGPGRAYVVSDAEMLDEDLVALKSLFKADGDGLPSDAVEKAAAASSRILSLFALPSDDIIENFKSSLSEMYVISSSKSSRLPLPETTGQWSPTDPNTLLRILCHRSDTAASKFLKKMYNIPKAT